jgi:hypothetical protein
MSKDDLPTYAIVEILIRLSEYNPQIGNYKDHLVHDNGVMVKTSNGHINFPHNLVIQQFNAPELITEDDLKSVTSQFKKAF